MCQYLQGHSCQISTKNFRMLCKSILKSHKFTTDKETIRISKLYMEMSKSNCYKMLCDGSNFGQKPIVTDFHEWNACLMYGTEHVKLTPERADSEYMFEQCPKETELASNSLYPIQLSTEARQERKVTTGVPCHPLLRVLGCVPWLPQWMPRTISTLRTNTTGLFFTAFVWFPRPTRVRAGQ